MQLTAKRKQAEDDMNNAIKYGKQVEEENERLKKQLETYKTATQMNLIQEFNLKKLKLSNC